MDTALQQPDTNPDAQKVATKRLYTYFIVGITIFVSYFFLRNVEWQGNKQLHTLMELLATTLATFVGILALVRYYTKKSNTFLFIGAGFFGTAFLDGYHTVVTSSFFDQLFPSVPASLIPWSWNASRTLLSVLMFLSWIAWRREERLGEQGKVSEKLVYWGVGIFTLASFAFFAFYPLPRAYYPELFFGRPEEFLSAMFFLLALIGYLSKGKWRSNHFEHWVVLSLIVNLLGQVMFMPFSFRLFDLMFDVAHTLKKVSYVTTLIGLLISMYYLFREAAEGKAALEKGLKLVENSKAKVEMALADAKQAQVESEQQRKIAEQQSAEAERLNKAMVGRELKMVELKKKLEKLGGDKS